MPLTCTLVQLGGKDATSAPIASVVTPTATPTATGSYQPPPQ